jgi:circadian clock protein KaiA
MASNSSDIRSNLIICTLMHSEDLVQVLDQHLQEDVSGTNHHRLTFKHFNNQQALFELIEAASPQTDCLVLENSADLPDLLRHLHSLSILIPAVIVEVDEPIGFAFMSPKPSAILTSNQEPADEQPPRSDVNHLYHAATLSIHSSHLSHIAQTIDEAIAKFLQLSADGQLIESESTQNIMAALAVRSSLMMQQKRLAEKLKERLGYLGVYYKRNPAHFLRHMSYREKQELLGQLKINYRQIILSYFSSETNLNQEIDSFVNLAFFADVPVAQIVEIHMELMDEFSKHLKLEGRSDEILLDYRLTLIDTIAHLCEMYRRSIPRES